MTCCGSTTIVAPRPRLQSQQSPCSPVLLQHFTPSAGINNANSLAATTAAAAGVGATMASSACLGTCKRMIWPAAILGAIVCVLLFPGFIFSLPPVPETPEKQTLASRIFFTGRVTFASVAVHGIIVLLALAAIWSAVCNSQSRATAQSMAPFGVVA